MVWLDHATFIKSNAWRKIRQKALAFHGRRCQVPDCRVRTRLEVHHIHYKRFGGKERVGDVTILCRKHHEEVTMYIRAHKGEADHLHLHYHWLFSKKNKRL